MIRFRTKGRGYPTRILIEDIVVGEIYKVYGESWVLSFKKVFWKTKWESKRSARNGVVFNTSKIKIRPQPYGQTCLHTSTLELAKHIASVVIFGRPDLFKYLNEEK